jgi:anti-anti-sigma factor
MANPKTSQSKRGTHQLVLEGELTIYCAAEIKTKLAQAMAQHDAIEVDLSGVTEVDTAGVQLMLIAKRNPGKKVLFTNHTANVLRMVDLARLGHTLGDPLVLDATQP